MPLKRISNRTLHDSFLRLLRKQRELPATRTPRRDVTLQRKPDRRRTAA